MGKRLVLAAVSDFLFSTRINEIARTLGLEVYFLRSTSEAFREFTVKPELLIIDLNNTRIDGIALTTRIRRDVRYAHLPIVGYLSHVQVQLKQQAEKAGCSLVLPRSVFADKLKGLLSGGLI
ncbi:MAG: hypothetical protein Q7R96_04410 [Nanoarchaeota archaeon]|nr:hypothetical protein [Nanoarchaeota archaeon]